MKKIILSLLLIICCGFCFAGCKENLPENYYTITGEELTTFFASEDFTKSLSYDFSAELEKLMAKDYAKNYAELKNIYAPLYEQTIYCATKYANVFVKGTMPTNDSDKLKKYFRNINSDLESFKREVSLFNTNRANYESYINFADDEAKSKTEIEKARLNRFKQAYLSLLNKAYSLSENIFMAYNEGYNSFINVETTSSTNLEPYLIEINLKLALNGSNLQLANSAIKTLQVYLNKEVNNEYDKLWASSVNFFTDTVKVAYNMTEDDFKAINADEMFNKFKVWKGVYDVFSSDAKTFNDIVSDIKLDVLKKYNYDTKKYAEVTNDKANEGKANFFLSYYKNIEKLNTYALNLINN